MGPETSQLGLNLPPAVWPKTARDKLTYHQRFWAKPPAVCGPGNWPDGLRLTPGGLGQTAGGNLAYRWVPLRGLTFLQSSAPSPSPISPGSEEVRRRHPVRPPPPALCPNPSLPPVVLFSDPSQGLALAGVTADRRVALLSPFRSLPPPGYTTASPTSPLPLWSTPSY